jgi:hypothetical protein
MIIEMASNVVPIMVDSGMLQGRRWWIFLRTIRRYWAGTARGSFGFEADKYKAYDTIPLYSHSPDLLDGI